MEKKKRYGWAVIVGICVLLIVLAAGAWMLFGRPGDMLAQAAQMEDDGEFAEAQAIYEEMGKTAWLSVRLSALPFGRYREAEERMQASLYREAETLMEEEQYARASDLFAALGDYRDAAERVDEPYMREGKALELKGAYADAALAYEKAVNDEEASAARAYCLGRVSLTQECYAEAEEWLIQAGSYADAAELKEGNAQRAEQERSEEARMAPYREAGHIVEWGHYEQDGDAENGPEPIRWITLQAAEDRIQLISEQVLDCIPYNTYIIITWEQSDIRAWLNGQFRWQAFSEEERAALRQAPVDPSTISRFGAQENNEPDWVTMLADSELNARFASPEEMAASATPYAVGRGAEQTDGAARWWLLMEGYDGDDAAIIDGANGKRSGVRVDERDVGVRPVIWLDLDAVAQRGGDERE